MNPIRWLLDFSARMAQRRGGHVEPEKLGYEKVDERDYQACVEIAGALLLDTQRQWPERWVGVSAAGQRMARVVEAQVGSFRLDAYEIQGQHWRQWEGPMVMDSLAEATALGQSLLGRDPLIGLGTTHTTQWLEPRASTEGPEESHRRTMDFETGTNT